MSRSVSKLSHLQVALHVVTSARKGLETAARHIKEVGDIEMESHFAGTRTGTRMLEASICRRIDIERGEG